MSDHYLWDRSGPPDPEVQRLERVLGELRHRGELDLRRVAGPPVWRWGWPAAAAAAIILIVVGVWHVRPRLAAHKTQWAIARVEGSAVVGGRAAVPSTSLYTGQVLRTGPTAKVTLQADDFGRIEVAPDSELRVVESAAAHQRLSFPRGLIHVLIWAPPWQFVVDTPSARAIDLGCQYTLSVDSGGNGLLKVETGWVAFQFERRESFIPAGAACVTSRQRGPGTPYFRDASESLRRSLETFDETGDPAALRHVLSEARPRDGFTLWHLLTRAPAGERGQVFDRFAQLVPLPPQVTRAGVLAADSQMLDLCWNALNLENAQWWREWKRQWPSTPR